MKKLFFVALYAITLTATFTACGPSKSGNYSKPTTDNDPDIPGIQSNFDSLKLPRKESGIFIPMDIQVTEPVENANDTYGEGNYPCHTYSATIFIIDSLDNEYSIFLSAVAMGKGVMDVELGKERAEEIRLEEEKKISSLKGLFQNITHSHPAEWKVECDGGTLHLYKIDKITDKKIGNLKVRQIEPGPMWSGNYKKISIAELSDHSKCGHDTNPIPGTQIDRGR
jgi:hypothetical protein